MSDYIEQTFNRADLQIIRGFLLNDIGDENDIDRRPYKQRIDEDSEPMRSFLESTYPDGEKRDAVFADISQAITAYQDVYFEIGLKCGARLLYQLLFERQPTDI
jgi:hypothetical protein